jgi:hypothetical protein
VARRTDMQTRHSIHACIQALQIKNLSGEFPWSKHPLFLRQAILLQAGLCRCGKRPMTAIIHLHEFLILMLAYVTRTTMYLQDWAVRYALGPTLFPGN